MFAHCVVSRGAGLLGRFGASVPTRAACCDSVPLSTSSSGSSFGGSGIFALRRGYMCTASAAGATVTASVDGDNAAFRSQPPTRDGDAVSRRLDRRFTHEITTLDPAKLVREDYIDTATDAARRPYYWIRFTDPNAGRRVARMEVRTLTGRNARDRILRGFLYFHTKPNELPLAGAIRFRATASDDPSTFASGHDHLNPHGIPWSIPLMSIATRRSYEAFRAILHHDGLVSDPLMELAGQNHHMFLFNGDQHLTVSVHAFGQPFPVRMAHQNLALVLLGADRATCLRLIYLPGIRSMEHGPGSPSGSVTWKYFYPFSGTALCCFERSTLKEHEGKRVVVIRILRFLESDPVRRDPDYRGPPYPDEIVPREGDLFMRLFYGKSVVWSVDVDNAPNRKTTHPLHVLFDNEEAYGPYTAES